MDVGCYSVQVLEHLEHLEKAEPNGRTRSAYYEISRFSSMSGFLQSWPKQIFILTFSRLGRLQLSKDPS